MPKALPASALGSCQEEVTKKKSKEEEEEEKEDQERQMRSVVTKEIGASMLEEVDTVGGGVTRNIGPV